MPRFVLYNPIIWVYLFFFLVFQPGYSQTTTTNTTLTDPDQIKTFLEATERIRCICLPSLPIQGCSYNMCIVSSYLKTFIENRIRKGESADTIVRKFENGFGDEILDDPVVLHFQKEGNQRMLDGLVNGFGPKIQAKPDSTWINLSLLAIGILGAIGIGIYLNGIRVRKKIPGNTGEQESGQNLPRNQDQTGSGKVVQTPTESKSADARKNLEDKYLKEI